MSNRSAGGVDLWRLLVAHERDRDRTSGSFGLAPSRPLERFSLEALKLDDARHATDAVAAAELVRGELASRSALDSVSAELAVAADLVAGHLPEALGRLRGLSPEQRAELVPLLDRVWGVGFAPMPPGLKRADGRKATDRGGGVHDMAWLLTLGAQSRQAWRVIDRATGIGFGTAAVIRGSWISERLTDVPLVLTCSHVCTDRSPQPGEPRSISPSRAALDWSDGISSAVSGTINVKALRWESPPDKLDASLLEVEALPAEALPPRVAPATEIVAGDLVYLWGYPGGKKLAVSFEDNDVVDVVDPRIFYDLATAGGSSGAPVFASSSHELVALHRAQALSDGRRHGTAFWTLLRALRAAFPPRGSSSE